MTKLWTDSSFSKERWKISVNWFKKKLINPFPPADAFWCNSSRRLLKLLWPKVKLVTSEQFLFWPQCFQLYLIFGDISHFCQFVFKVICCRNIVCGRGLRVENVLEIGEIAFFCCNVSKYHLHVGKSNGEHSRGGLGCWLTFFGHCNVSCLIHI